MKLIMQTSERSTAMKSQSVIASDYNFLKSCAGTSSLSECEPLSMDAQLWECRAYYAPHIAKSLERTIQRCNDYVVQQADNDGYVVTKAGFQGRGELGLTHFLVSLNVESNKYVCIDGCGKSIFKGKPCVHMVKVFQHLGLPLFQASYVHEHWKIMKNWNFDNIKKRCGERSVEDEDDDGGNNGHDDDGDGDGEQSDDVTNDDLFLNDAI